MKEKNVNNQEENTKPALVHISPCPVSPNITLQCIGWLTCLCSILCATLGFVYTFAHFPRKSSLPLYLVSLESLPPPLEDDG